MVAHLKCWLVVSAVAVAASLFGPAKLLADTIVIGGNANPGRAWNSTNTLYVDAISVVTPGPWEDNLPTIYEVIQNTINAELTAAGQAGNWPLPVQGNNLGVTFTVNTAQNPNNYRATNTYWPTLGQYFAGASLFMTTQGMGAGEHWLQLVHTNYLLDPGPYNGTNTWPDPSPGGGYWFIDNLDSPGKPFYDQTIPNSPQPPNFGDQPSAPWNGTSIFHAYLFVADMDPNTNVITLHDRVYWGVNEPVAPEPSSLTLFGLGILAVVWYGRRSIAAMT